MKVLVLGARGQLGTDVVRTCNIAGDDVVAVGRAELDITDEEAVDAIIGETRPTVIVNCAAWTAVDACETDPQRALSVNGTAAGIVAVAARRTGAHLVHISTDYVFSGELDRPYDERDSTGPRSVYGESKLAGEQLILEHLPTATVVRTSWVFSEHGNNMALTALRLLEGEAPMRFVDDQRGCPTYTADLAPMLRRLAIERIDGVVHVTNQGATTWYGFVREIAVAAGRDPDRVVPIRTAELVPPRPARRPANSVLDNAVLRSRDIPLLRPFDEALRELVATLVR